MIHARIVRVLTVGSLLIAASIVHAQDADAGKQRIDKGPWIKALSRPRKPISVQRKVMVPMRDGVKLAVDVYTPNEKHAGADGKFPTIIHRTPYGRHLDPSLFGNYFAERGYVYVAQDVRGRFDSEGEWFPFRDELSDGADTIGWIVRQPWCNGVVGALGGSYEGYCAWMTAKSGSEHLRAVAALVAVADPDRLTPYRNGVFHLSMPIWAKFLEILQAGGNPFAMPIEKQLGTARVLPLGDVDDYIETTHDYIDVFLAHPPSDDAYWESMCYQRDFGDINVASLSITGWYDVHEVGSTTNFAGMRRGAKSAAARDSQHLIIGPWPHMLSRTQAIGEVDFGQQSMIDLLRTTQRFFDHYLKGIDTGLADEPPVTVFSMGDNRWHRERDWPIPETQETTLFLKGDGSASRRDGGGRLVEKGGGESAAGATSAEFEAYRYDPDDPADWLGMFAMAAMPQLTEDKSKTDDRADVLDFTSPPLAAPAEITGEFRAKLFVSTSAADTDFAIEVCRLTADGKLYRLAGGIQRLRYRTGRDKPVPPGTIVPVEIACMATSQRFEAGDRIRLQIGSAALPAHARNLNTLDPLPTATRTVVAENRVYCNAANPSALVVPFVPRPDAPALKFAN